MLILQRRKFFRLTVPVSLAAAYVWGKGLGVFAQKNFKKGDTVIRFRADTMLCSKASAESVQIDAKNCFDTKWLTIEAFINHGCNANTRLDVKGERYVAIKNIRKNDEITFNYLATDWDLKNEAFDCCCGAKNCYGRVRGLRYLSRPEQEKLRPQLLPFLIARLDRKK